jgi:type I restriction enzyme, S subunit
MVLEIDSPLGPLPDGWILAYLVDLTTKIGSGATPLGGEAAYLVVRDKYALIRSQNIFDRKFDSKNLAYISSQDAHRLDGVEVQPKDILLNITGDGITFSRACMVDTTVLPARVNQHVSIIRAKKEILDPGYLLSYLTHPQIKYYMESYNAGGSRRALTKAHIESFVIPLPPIEEQRAIARILSSLDDKIELNRHMNETLEAIARAIFKSWFVDFDPVRAKVEGREPAGMDAETAALFPDSFEETELGMVPMGWGVGSFDETIELIGGGTPKTSVPEYWNGDIPWFSIVDAPENSDVFVIDTDKKITRIGLDESSTRLLPKSTTIITARGTVGKCALVGNPMAMNQSCYGVRAMDLRGDYFIYFAIRNLVSELQRSTHGSVFDTITSETFKTVQVVIVPIQLTRIFDEKIWSFMGQILSNLQESETIVTLRNTLLPKLLSGEIRLKDSEITKEAK